MYGRKLLLVQWFSLVLLYATTSVAQTNDGTQHAVQPSNAPVTQPPANSTDVIYTGKLLGYFRVPSLQKLEKFKGCHLRSAADDSPAANEFLKERDKHPNVLLVGTGDNFSPQLEARIFSDVPSNPNKYAVGNKELYFSDNNDFWFPVEELEKHKKVQQDIRDGYATIPTDNVGCFLRAAHFDAIVPGKHDFYFGAERVRQFARLLAEPQDGEFKPVQMLGANLVMSTTALESKEGSSKITADLKFQKWPDELSVLNLKDVVYPWFSYVNIELIDWTKKDSFLNDLKVKFPEGSAPLSKFIAEIPKIDDASENKLRRNADRIQRIEVCLSKDGPNDFDIANCKPLVDPKRPLVDRKQTFDPEVSWNETKITVSLALPPKFYGTNNHFSTLTPGKNHFLCVMPQATETEPGCLRFAANTPFFYFPHEVPRPATNGYNDPEPFVIKGNTAIFGVVDPALNDQIGVLNAGWRNVHPELTSRMSVEDPYEALREQLDYFDYYQKVKKSSFNGLKILLVQANPQRAQALGAKFPEFQIVVTAADTQQATSESERTTRWRPDGPTSSFLAIPSPYFNSSTGKGAVHFGIVTAIPSGETWELIANHLPPVPIVEPHDPATDFWENIKKVTSKQCVSANFKAPDGETYSEQTYLKWLVLCTMREQLGADIALVQTRDFFGIIPDLTKAKYPLLDRTKLGKTAAENEENIQQTLDRLIWKGDLLTLILVPGADLRKALKQSAAYVAEESATFSLAVDRGRQLETLGVREDNGNYFVNELPLDDSRVYAIATTDFIGSGDTGYPDLAKAALNPRTHPAAYTGKLVSISSLVCRKLVTNTPDKFCLGPVESSDYLDETAAEQTTPFKPKSLFSRLWKATGLEWPGKDTRPSSTAEAVEQKVQQRGFWSFSLKNFSFGFKNLHNNDTDESLGQKFGGINESGLTAQGSLSYSFNVDTRTSYSAHNTEFFIGNGIEFERQRQGIPVEPIGISQVKNRFFTDVGVVFWKRPGRALPNLGAVFSGRGETQLQQPFSVFKLSTATEDQLQIDRPRSLLMLGRVGVRWQNRLNTAEVGGQYGRELRALNGYRFEGPAGTFECLANAAQTISDCISTNSKPPGGLITADSTPIPLTQSRPRAGIYWNHTLSIPFSDRLKYEVTQDADFFFVNFHNDTSIDTRFRYSSTNRLSFMIWPNFSIGPTLDLLMFQNKRNRDFFFQRQIGFETKLTFDIFNRREKGVQIKHKP